MKLATPWDAVYKQVFVRFLSALGVPVQTQVEVGRLPKTLDAVVVADESQRAQIVQ